MAQVNLSNMFINMAVSNQGNNSSIKASNEAVSKGFSSTLSSAQKASEKKQPTTKTQTDQSANKVAKTESYDSNNQTKESQKSQSDTKNKVKDDTKPSEKPQDVKDAKVDQKESLKDTKVSNKDDEHLDEEKEVSKADQIVNLISQILNLPVETINDMLTAAGLQPEDLLSSEGFGTFMGAALSEGDTDKLLTTEVDFKQMKTLYEALSQLDTQPDDHASQLMETAQKAGIALHEAAASFTKVQPAVSQETGEEVVQQQVVVASENHFNSTSLQADTNKQPATYLNEGTTSEQALPGIKGADQMGMSMPIQQLNATSFEQNFKGLQSIVTQGTFVKEIDGEQFILKQIDFKTLGQTKELTLQLAPKELGTMHIKIVENNGALVAEINVENDKTKELLQNDLTLLKENLEKQGLNITEVKVDIRQNQAQSQMEQERQKSSKRIQEIIDKQYEEADEEETHTEPIRAVDSEVDYMV